MNLIPWPYRWLAMVVLAVALVGFGWVKGAGYVKEQWDAEVSRQAARLADVHQRQAEASVQVVTKYVDRIKVVREKGDAIIKEVPIYVPVEADAACRVNRGFVRLHDAAAAGELPGTASLTDAATAGVALSTVAGTVVDNYGRCHENAEQLIALQDWVRRMQVAANSGHLE